MCASVHKCYGTTYLRQHYAHNRADYQPRHVVTVCPQELAHMALPIGCDGDAPWRRVLTWVGVGALLAALPPAKLQDNCKVGWCVGKPAANPGPYNQWRRPARPRATSVGAPVGPYRLRLPAGRKSGLGMTDPLAPRPTAAEQVEGDRQQVKRYLTDDGVRGRATVVCGDPAEATLHIATHPPLAWR
jgi:hypothetical protein